MTTPNANRPSSSSSSTPSVFLDLLCINCIEPSTASVVNDDTDNRAGASKGVGGIENQLCGIDISSIISNTFGGSKDGNTMADANDDEKNVNLGDDATPTQENNDDDNHNAEDLDQALADLDIPSEGEFESEEDDSAIKSKKEKGGGDDGGGGVWNSVRNAFRGSERGGEDKSSGSGKDSPEAGDSKGATIADDEKKEDDGPDNEENPSTSAAEEEPGEKETTCSYSTINQRPFSERELESITAWKERLQRDEVFSLRYRPNEEESMELNELALYLGLERQDAATGAGAASPQPKKKQQQSSSSILSSPGRNSFWGFPFGVNANNDSTSLATLITPDVSQKQPQSILLKRGPVWIEDKKKKGKRDMKVAKKASDDANADTDASASATVDSEATKAQGDEYELVLLTHGFILIKIPGNDDEDSSKPQDLGASLSNIMGFTSSGPAYESCKIWTMVQNVKDSTTMDATGNISWKFGIVLDDPTKKENKDGKATGETLEFAVGSQAAMEAWLLAVGQILIQNALHDPNQREMTEKFGWQYKLLQRPGFTVAVTGNVDDLYSLFNSMMINEVEVTAESSSSTTVGTTKERLNVLDSYHQMAPLHYAIQQDPCNKEIIEALLQAGADPNLPDGEKRSAMYYGKFDINRSRLIYDSLEEYCSFVGNGISIVGLPCCC